MPVLIEHIYDIVVSIVVIVLLGTGALIIMAIARRQRRDRYFRRIDDLRQRYGPVIASMLSQKLEYERGREVLKGISGIDRDQVLEQLCLEKKPTPDQVPILRRLCEELGLVKIWRIEVMPLVTAVIVLVFGGLTLILHDELFIKLKPTIIYVLFGGVLLGGLAFGK